LGRALPSLRLPPVATAGSGLTFRLILRCRHRTRPERSCGACIDKHGVVVEQFFDVGQSRSIPWKRRPEAARLLAAIKASPEFDAVVTGEPQRAFCGNQYGPTYPVLQHYGVALWVPEVGGPIDPESEAHDLVMSVFGGMSKGERNRIKISNWLFERRCRAERWLRSAICLECRPADGEASRTWTITEHGLREVALCRGLCASLVSDGVGALASTRLSLTSGRWSTVDRDKRVIT
jgi:hypothetical protein